ncbi:D-glycero-alpha-D-manno-heptose-1,7-bisphosphate 7-phosphatase [Helicobacter felis]|uniref:D-glycero-alpha-D-manno-heptose-1,7-bisphosphate 7-phosphatase n=1 Tax=Helicobacter felis TaxID=214 RepID=UPI000CED81FA|nr:HAD family hydrolase [Helicobacter felis]
MKRKALFLDRDGVVNVDRGYVHTCADFEFMPGIFELLAHAKACGYLLLLVTNQSGIGRGYYSEQDFETLSTYMQEQLEKMLGFGLDRIYHCPHAPTHHCFCRKPQIGMAKTACQDFKLDLTQSVMLGDKKSDMQFGHNAGIGTNLWLQTCPQTPLEYAHSISTLQQVLDFLKHS